MSAADARALSCELAGDVDEAAEIAREQQLRLGGRDVRRLAADHGVGDIGVLPAKEPAEATASLGLGHLDELGAGKPAEQLARLALDAKLTQARAAVMVGDAPGKRAGHGRELAHIDQEGDELVHTLGEADGTGGRLGVIGEEPRVVHLQHGRARPRRRDDVIEAVEGRDRLQRERARRLAVAAVVGRLPAAGLRRRHLDIAAGGFEQAHRREADGWAQDVDEAGDEEADARPLGLGCHLARPLPGASKRVRRRPRGDLYFWVLRKAMRSLTSASFLMPANAITPLGTKVSGESRYCCRLPSVQTRPPAPFALSASE